MLKKYRIIMGRKDDRKDRKKKNILFSVLLGEVLYDKWVTSHLSSIMLILLFFICYVALRYEVQGQMVRIDKLKKELVDIRYISLTRKSELMERSRQSCIEELVNKSGSELRTATDRPFLIKKD